MAPKIHHIVLTGGPCGGKTTILIALAERLEEAGFIVLVAFEGATALMLNRVHPKKLGVETFQRSLFDFDLGKVEWIERTAARVSAKLGKSVAVIHDRTWLDAKAYTDAALWETLVAEYRPFERCAAQEWNVIHVVTAADGAEPFYTLENNQARFETPEEARERDRLLADAYQSFEHRFVIGNDGAFERKVHRAVEAACRFVGIPEPLEIERWFEVDGYNETMLAGHKAVRVEIFQFYLPDGSRYRRRKLPDGSLTFSRTWKRSISGDPSARIETSAPIGAFEFGEALERHRDAPNVDKTRFVFDYGGYRLELDVFRKPSGIIKLEIETPTRGEQVRVPDWISVKREVTGDRRFSNEALARLP